MSRTANGRNNYVSCLFRSNMVRNGCSVNLCGCDIVGLLCSCLCSSCAWGIIVRYTEMFASVYAIVLGTCVLVAARNDKHLVVF